MDFIALDIETTGLSPYKDRIIEIGAARYCGGVETDRFVSFVQPERKLPERITELTGITDAMLVDAPQEDVVLDAFLAFADNLPLLGHNLLFDYGFIKYAVVKRELSYERSGIDTLRIAKQFLPGLESRSLEFLCRHFQIDNGNAHRAYDDARSAARLYGLLYERYGQADAAIFREVPLQYSVKKIEPMTPSQKNYLNDLIKYHKIECNVPFEGMTKSEASRMIDRIIVENGKIPAGSRIPYRGK